MAARTDVARRILIAEWIWSISARLFLRAERNGRMGEGEGEEGGRFRKEEVTRPIRLAEASRRMVYVASRRGSR